MYSFGTFVFIFGEAVPSDGAPRLRTYSVFTLLILTLYVGVALLKSVITVWRQPTKMPTFKAVKTEMQI